MAESVDTGFGRIRATLQELGLEENTLLILGSDNGPSIHQDGDAQHDGERLGQLRGMKGDVYEGGIRTPWFMRWPGQFSGSQEVKHVAAHIDILPTILDACGVPSPTGVVLDGISLLPMLRNPSAAWPQRTVFIQWDSNDPPTREACFAAITDEWKLVQPCGMTSKGPILGQLKQYEKICKEIGFEQRNISNSPPRFELYRIRQDQGERADLAASQPEMVTDLRKQYNAWLDQIEATARWHQAGEPARSSKPKGKPGPDE